LFAEPCQDKKNIHTVWYHWQHSMNLLVINSGMFLSVWLKTLFDKMLC